MTKVLGDAVAEIGGGRARHLVVHYLTQDVAGWLNGTFTESTGRELFAATSEGIRPVTVGAAVQDMTARLDRLHGPCRRGQAHLTWLANGSPAA